VLLWVELMRRFASSGRPRELVSPCCHLVCTEAWPATLQPPPAGATEAADGDGGALRAKVAALEAAAAAAAVEAEEEQLGEMQPALEVRVRLGRGGLGATVADSQLSARHSSRARCCQ
jgi:hypothetical protein